MRAGVHLGSDRIHVARAGGWPKREVEAFEVSWDPSDPAAGLEALRAHLEPTDRLYISVDAALLHVRRVELPPVPVEERERILALEPSRFFAVDDEEFVFAVRESDPLVFAVREATLARWIERLERIGTVESVEPGPLAFARALKDAELKAGWILQTGDSEGATLLELENGDVRQVRRLFGDASSALEAAQENHRFSSLYLTPWSPEAAERLTEADGSLTETRVEKLPLPPALAGLDERFLTAYGSALAVPARREARLLPSKLRERLRRRARRQTVLAAVALIAAAALFLYSLDFSRERRLAALERTTAELRERAEPTLARQARLAGVIRETRTIDEIEAGRSQPLKALLEISELLPDDVHVSLFRLSGDEWRIDGQAGDAAALIPLLETHPDFADVRFLSATSRRRTGTETYESFSLAFRYAPAS